MTRRLSLLALAAAAAAVAAPFTLASAPAAAQAQRDWSRTIVATPEGGFRMGNPDAAMKLVEYVSLTCPHCRHFAEAGAPALVRDHVAGGRLSFEIRPFPLDIVAATAAQLNSCAAPANAFRLNDAILSGQPQIFSRLEALPQEEIQAIEALAPAALRQRIVAATGIDAIAAAHGLGPVQVRACLADDAGAARIDAIKATAEQIGIGGTPSFTLNGRVLQNVHDWAALQPLLTGR
ncbi:MAG TPA: thioredoxin domain-containing protein [Allosphingosinicella sp.]|jgi:protein-disulfide isomerase